MKVEEMLNGDHSAWVVPSLSERGRSQCGITSIAEGYVPESLLELE